MRGKFFLPMIFLVAGCYQQVENDHGEPANLAPSIELTGRVVDQADLLSAETEKELTRVLENLEKTSGPQFVIASTKSLNGRKIEDYSIDLARIWAIGDKHRDDGVLMLVALNEQKVRIEVGRGLEASLSDSFCSKVIREDMLPPFSAGKMEAGIANGAARLIEKMQMVPTIPANDNVTGTAIQDRKAS
mgnify:CR=1 FL=1|tara:strand:- start:397 stop:963 length:567 start_codon:yes stop_codon:yes gene_type:complete